MNRPTLILLGAWFFSTLLAPSSGYAQVRFGADWLFLSRDNDSDAQLISGPDAVSSGDMDFDYESGYRLNFGVNLWEYELDGEELPQPGDYSVVLDGAGAPLCVIQTIEVNVRAFDEVDPSFAYDEGEGDRSLDYWRRVHWDFFSATCRRIGRQPSVKMPVVLERFRLLFPPQQKHP